MVHHFFMVIKLVMIKGLEINILRIEYFKLDQNIIFLVEFMKVMVCIKKNLLMKRIKYNLLIVL
jgi:hypothetical protein